VAIALFTSRWWQSDLKVVHYSAHPPVRDRAVWAAIAIFIQLLLGAAYRHHAFGILPHLIGAVIVPFFVLSAVGSASARAFDAAAGLVRCGTMLKHVLYMQLALGGAALWSRLATQHAPQPMPVMVFFTVAHTAVGALTLALAVLLVLVSFRVLGPVQPAEVTASHSQMAGQEGGAS
jgi:hypothetical protein